MFAVWLPFGKSVSVTGGVGLRPFFSLYGGKWRTALRYPAPDRRLKSLVEPFAGSAGYALRYPEMNVILVEKDEKIAGTWDYILRVGEAEIRKLPVVVGDGGVSGLGVIQEAEWLIGWWLNKGTTYPGRQASAWMRRGEAATACWGAEVRERIAGQLEAVRHWKLIWGDYREAPDIWANWFIDPPYVGSRAGKKYRHGSGKIDYEELAEWSTMRRGQVVVCEHLGAGWLPFEEFGMVRGTIRNSEEVLWVGRYRAPGEGAGPD